MFMHYHHVRSPISTVLLRLMLSDQSSVTDLNLSNNPSLLSLVSVYQELEKVSNPIYYDTFIQAKGGPASLQPLGDISTQFYHMLTLGRLKHLNLDNCGMTDMNMEMFSQGLVKSSSLQSIRLSINHLGPTSLNWITTVLG